jgi:periplasmic divalent cation tolerance protein
MDQTLVLLSTVDTRSAAETLARTLVERRLAACVNVIDGVVSTYRWQGEVSVDSEFLLVIKTHAERYDDLCLAIRELHQYDQPELIALPVVAGDPGYLDWLRESVEPELP